MMRHHKAPQSIGSLKLLQMVNDSISQVPLVVKVKTTELVAACILPHLDKTRFKWTGSTNLASDETKRLK